jgi:hypothetical protein
MLILLISAEISKIGREDDAPRSGVSQPKITRFGRRSCVEKFTFQRVYQ